MSYLARVSYTGNGSTTQYALPFSYLATTHIKAYLDNVETSAFTVSGSTLTFTSAPAGAVAILIKRVTPTDARLVDFQDGSVLTESDLDKSADQNFYIAQESSDDNQSTLSLNNASLWDATNKRIINVADPTSAQDAATKNYIENTWLSSADKTNLTAVAAVTTEMGLLGTADAIADMNTLGTADVVADLNTLGTADVVADLNTLGTADAVADMNTLATAQNVTNMNTLAGISANITTVAGISSNVTTVAGISSDVTAVAGDATDIGAVAAKATEIGLLGTADAVADLAILGTADVVADMNTLATADIVSDMNTLGTADVVSDMNTLGTAQNVTNMNTLAGISANITTVAGISSNVTSVAGISSDVTSVAGISSDVTTVAGMSSDVSSFANRYRISTNDPSTSLDAGDLAYVSSANALKYYDGSSWNAITTDTDVKVGVSANDTTAGYLNGKLVAGSNITFTENNDGGNETLTLAAADNSIPFAIALGS